jgi:hypothetical protein
MASNPAAKATAAAERLIAGLENPAALGGITAKALLDAAQAAAQRRPTPQAPMVAAAFTADDQAIRGPSSGKLADIAPGAEYGSNRYGQFHAAYSSRGHWLFPTIDNPPAGVEDAQAEYLDRLTHG